jgi:peptidoglycan/xylan/chitin deacetylase (PgdA/CDA1 family)
MVTLPKNLLTSTGTLYEDFEMVDDWSARDGNITANTSDFKTGTQSVKLTTNPSAIAVMKKTVNYDLSGNWQRMYVWVYFHNDASDYDTSHSTLINLSTTMDYSKYFQQAWTQGMLALHIAPGWNLISFAKNSFANIHGADWNAPIVGVRFQIAGATGKVTSVSFDSLFFSVTSVPCLLLVFDDGYPSQYNALKYMQQYGMRGSLAVISEWIGKSYSLTVAQLMELNAAGHAIVNHTSNGTDLSTLVEIQQEEQISRCKMALDGWGLTRCSNYVVYPSGGYNANTRTAMANLGMLVGRSTASDIRGVGHIPVCLPNSDIYGIGSHGITNTDLVTAESYIDQCIEDGMVLVLHIHDIGSSGHMTVEDFQIFIDYVRAKALAGLINVITIDDFYNLQARAVRVPMIK